MELQQQRQRGQEICANRDGRAKGTVVPRGSRESSWLAKHEVPLTARGERRMNRALEFGGPVAEAFSRGVAAERRARGPNKHDRGGTG